MDNSDLSAYPSDLQEVLKEAYQQQSTLAKNLAKLFGARFKQAVSEVLETTNFDR